LRAASKAAQPAMTAPATMAAAIASSKGSKADDSVHVSPPLARPMYAHANSPMVAGRTRTSDNR
jgi:hypothetical protein